jgi:hypothetical protein
MLKKKKSFLGDLNLILDENNRISDLDRFYNIIHRLIEKVFYQLSKKKYRRCFVNLHKYVL